MVFGSREGKASTAVLAAEGIPAEPSPALLSVSYWFIKQIFNSGKSTDLKSTLQQSREIDLGK